MHFNRHILAAVVGTEAILVSARPPSVLAEDDSITWGPAIFAMAGQEIIRFSTLTYPGTNPPNQQGNGLFLWPGLLDIDQKVLVQSIVGSYPPGKSLCSGTNVDTEWYERIRYFGPRCNRER